MGTSFSLRFDKAAIRELASRYSYDNDTHLETEVALRVKTQGFLTKEDFLALCRWKSVRPQKHCKLNSEEDIVAITKIALSTKDEKIRIGVLTTLQGVKMRTASAILHFVGNDRYPIIDVRALWSLGVAEPVSYGFKLWWTYVEFCRQLADNANVSMRTLDRALWQYSAENQQSLQSDK